MSKQREALKLALNALEAMQDFGYARRSQEIIELVSEALAEPEPVAWLSEGGDVSRSKRYMDEMGFICEPLYTAPPPARKPLTDEQISELRQKTQHIDFVSLRVFGIIARAIEGAHGITDE